MRGSVRFADPEFNNQPDVALVVEAAGNTKLQPDKVAPIGFPGQAQGTQALQQIWSQGRITARNYGVANMMLQSPYFPGSIWQQVNRCLQHLRCFGFYDPQQQQLAIWPKPQQGGSSVGGGSVATISPKPA